MKNKQASENISQLSIVLAFTRNHLGGPFLPPSIFVILLKCIMAGKEKGMRYKFLLQHFIGVKENAQ